MPMLLRLLFVIATARTREPCDALGPSSIPLRVLPTDLDVLRHVNNGVYLSMLDLARVDLMLRSGLGAKLRAQGFYAVVAAQTIRFRRSLELFDRFEITTRVIGWDEKAFLLEHRFLRGGEVVAEAVIRSRFLKKSGGGVSTAEVLALAGVAGPSPPLPDWIDTWNTENGGAPVAARPRPDSRAN